MFEVPDEGSVIRGMAIALGLHVLQIAIVPLLLLVSGGVLAGIALFGWCITQFIYLGPAYRKYKREGETETAKGILIAAGVGVLLNGACDASLMNLK